MNVVKRLIAIFAVAVLLVGMMAGCNTTGGGAALTGEYIVIKAQLNGLKEAWLANAAAAFTHKTGIRVEYEFDSMLSGTMQNVLETDGLAVADLYFVQTGEWPRWAEAGYLADLTTMMDQPDENGKSLNDRIIGNNHYLLDSGEKVNYVVPLTYAPTALAYNKPMMDYLCHDVLGWEEGHDYPINTKELREVFNAMEKVTAEGTKKDLFTYEQSGKTHNAQPMVWSGSTGYLEMMLYPWLYQYMGLDGTEKYYNQTADINMLGHDAFYYAYQEMMDLLALELDSNNAWTSGTSIPGCASFNHVTSQQRFIRGQALICPTGSWFWTESSDLIEEENMADKLGFMPVPWLSDAEGNYLIEEGATPATDAEGNYQSISRMNNIDFFMIPETAEYPELAKEFLLFLFSEEYMPTLCEDLQSPMCFEFDDSQVEKTDWFKQVDYVMDHITPVESWAPTKLFCYGRVGIYYNPYTPPFASLVQSAFGSSTVWIDTATGKKVASREAATGLAVTENLYNYLQGNLERGKIDFRLSKQELGV